MTVVRRRPPADVLSRFCLRQTSSAPYCVRNSKKVRKSFTPGPGARDGISKCFRSLGGLNEAEIIRLVAQRQGEEFARVGEHFPSLWGRPLQLVDCQSLFCEVDKYARVFHPEVHGLSGRERIKQTFRPAGTRIRYWFPPKW